MRYFDVSTGQTSYQTLFRVLHRHSLQAIIFLLRRLPKSKVGLLSPPPSTSSTNCKPAPPSSIEPASRRTKEIIRVAPTPNGIWCPNFVCTTYPVEPGTSFCDAQLDIQVSSIRRSGRRNLPLSLTAGRRDWPMIVKMRNTSQ